MPNILVVEDNKDLRELLCIALDQNGFSALGAGDGEEALKVMDNSPVDLIVADIMMPNMDGYELTDLLRQSNNSVPILMITARDDYDSMQKGFLRGADDYMVKPVDLGELMLRVRALLRRAKISSEKKIIVGNTVIDQETMTVTMGAENMELPLKEFQLLFKLISYPGKIFTRRQLMDEIWGMDSESDERTINTHINRLRDRFADCEDFEIVTVRGLGYKAVKK